MDSDPDIEFIEKDSGMSSLVGSKDDTPERRSVSGSAEPSPPALDAPAAPSNASIPKTTKAAEPKAAENYDDEPDETLAERLWGLTEMFPDKVRRFTETVSDLTTSSVKGLYKFTCDASWIFFTSSIILFAPVIFETERAQMEEMQKTQQKQVLLGPGSAMAATGGPSPSMPAMH